jgi:hypothetical protein
MARLWRKNADGWSAEELAGAGSALIEAGTATAFGADASAATALRASVMPVDIAGAKFWALIFSARSDARVNGAPVAAGLRVLADRDEIRVDGEVRYFSTESVAVVVPLPATERSLYCGRCRLKIEAGSPAIYCPTCAIWYHQSAELPCWTYAPKCGYCPQQTALDLDAEFAWTPEED